MVKLAGWVGYRLPWSVCLRVHKSKVVELSYEHVGHCWSNESHWPPLPSKGSIYSGQNRLHPSREPKCTHAYALRRSGARRLLLHLRQPFFAYSRAIDQAFAWLIRSGRIRAFSVVPAVIVQTKLGDSDVSLGSGSDWRDSLESSALSED